MSRIFRPIPWAAFIAGAVAATVAGFGPLAPFPALAGCSKESLARLLQDAITVNGKAPPGGVSPGQRLEYEMALEAASLFATATQVGPGGRIPHEVYDRLSDEADRIESSNPALALKLRELGAECESVSWDTESLVSGLKTRLADELLVAARTLRTAADSRSFELAKALEAKAGELRPVDPMERSARQAAHARSETVLRDLIERMGNSKDMLEKRVRAYGGPERAAPPIRDFPGKKTNFGLTTNMEGVDFHGTRIWTEPGDPLFSRSGVQFTYIRFERFHPSSSVAYKVYLTLPPDQVEGELPELLRLAHRRGAGGAKVKFGEQAVAERDRVIVYFSRIGDANRFAEQLSERFKLKRSFGDDLPFTHRVGPAGSPVFLAVDPVFDYKYSSWRSKITSLLSNALEVCSGAGRLLCVQKYLRYSGVDPDFWLPVSEVGRLQGPLARH
jgi:hypothetical protein